MIDAPNDMSSDLKQTAKVLQLDVKPTEESIKNRI